MTDDREGVPAIASGDGQEAAESLDRLMGLVYEELRAVAARRLRDERPDHTLQPTALVHEAYLRLSRRPDLTWESRAHFFRVAARQIRRVLVDHARSRNRAKRSGRLLRVTLGEHGAVTGPDVDVLALDEALSRLDEHAPQDRRIVELKFFGGLNEEEIATVLGISDRTVRRRWTFARAWLFRELAGDQGGSDERR
jgi:RNA polymerase sigma factor (TIGR02999 family)